MHPEKMLLGLYWRRYFVTNRALICLPILGLACCSEPNYRQRLYSEERAYLDLLGTVYAETCRVGTTIQVSDPAVTLVDTKCVIGSTTNAVPCAGAGGATKNQFVGSLGAVIDDPIEEVLDLATKRLPPQTLEAAHRELLSALEVEAALPENDSLSESGINQFKNVCQLKEAFDNEVADRDPIANDSVYFVELDARFISIVADTEDGVSLTPQISISTPVGGLTGGFRPPDGVSNVIVHIGDQERHFKFDRPFAFRSESGFVLSYEDGDTMHISLTSTQLRSSADFEHSE